MVGRSSKRRRSAVAVLSAVAGIALLAAASPAGAIPWDMGGRIPPAQTPAPSLPDPLCDQSYADDAPSGGPRLHFGVGPRLAGEVGAAQSAPPVPEDPARRDAALKRLAGTRSFTVRLNRLFMADGNRGIRQFKRMAKRYGKLGFNVELQVRYHPDPEDEGDMGAWLDYVRAVVRAFGPLPYVTGLQITNEANFTLSPNTSDGAYENAVGALIRGVKTAKRYSLRLGHDQLRIGFNFAWLRLEKENDAAFWARLAEQGGRALRRATDWVGIDLYPGTYMPPDPVIADYGDAFLEGLAQMRECYMPMGGFGPEVPLRIEETGWPTGPGRSEQRQLEVARGIVETAVAYRGTYGITDFRWFGLRDNDSSGPDYQSYFGLLRSDYSAKPAFAEYRRLVARYGAPDRRPGKLRGPGRRTAR